MNGICLRIIDSEQPERCGLPADHHGECVPGPAIAKAMNAAPPKLDWADRRAREFYELHLDGIRTPTRAYVLAVLAADYRDLANACEPRDSLDM